MLSSGLARTLCFLAASLLWLGQTLGHGQGNVLAGLAFRELGFLWGERLCILGAALCFSGAFLWCFRAFRRIPNQERAKPALIRFLLAVLLWTLLAVLTERFFVVLRSELYHYVQYGLIAGLYALALPRPGLVLLLGTSLGALDELHQMATLHPNFPGTRLDLNDCILNLVGSAGGILVVTTAQSLRALGSAAESPSGALPGRFSLAITLLLFAAAGLASTGFESSFRPFWSAWDGVGGKAYHELLPGAGRTIVFLATVLLFLLFEDQAPARRSLGLVAVLLLPLPLLATAKGAPEPLSPRLPEIAACRSSGTIQVDGQLDEETWRRCPRARIQHLRDGRSSEGAVAEVQIAWDERRLYLAFRVSDQDIWAQAVRRDDPQLPQEEVVEAFIATSSEAEDGGQYYELELSPAGVLYDLAIHYRGGPGKEPFDGDASWSPKGLEAAVAIQGSLSKKAGPVDQDQGWTAELAIDFAELGLSAPPRTGAAAPPWRVNFFQIDRPRGPTAEPRLSCWSPPLQPSFHQPRRFGRLFFSDKIGRLRKEH